MLNAWLDLFHGSHCLGCARPGALLCPGCAVDLPMSAHRAHPTPCPEGLRPSFATTDYAGVVREMIVTHKEHNGLSLCRPLGDLLARSLAALLTSSPLDESVQVLLVPIPSRRQVVRQRGHDPLLGICRRAAQVARDDSWRVRVAPLLRHRLSARDQSGLSAADRATNLSDTLMVSEAMLRGLVRGGRPVLCVIGDDIITTGATVREAQRALEAVGLPVLGIATIAATVRQNPGSLPFCPAAD